MSFEDFELDSRILRILKKQDITDPTLIQEKAIPALLEGKDVTALAQTGTGKTLAFALPALTRVAEEGPRPGAILVLTPTRELTRQVHDVVEPYAKALKLRTALIYGGVGYQSQVTALRNGAEVVVATPGRLLDHLERGNANFQQLRVLILDEADRMLDMGFLPDVRRIVQRLKKKRQTVMSSATFPGEIARLAEQMMHEPVTIEAGAVHQPVDQVRQRLYTVKRPMKLRLLKRIVREEKIESGLVFMRTKSRVERVTKALRRMGFKAQSIHGDRSQIQRQRALEGFREGRYNLLVATDVAARGLDIQGISHVFNYDIPENPDDYLHRIGRTARAEAEGTAITFVCPDEHLPLEAIERALDRNLPRVEWEDSVPVLSLYKDQSRMKAAGKDERAKLRASVRRRPRSLFGRR